jgi:diguanylate cyclase
MSAAPEAVTRLSILADDLGTAIARRQLTIAWLPQTGARSGEVTGAQAHLRWMHPEQGVVSPVVFLPLAERQGLAEDIGQWLIDDACRQAGTWRAAGLGLRVAVPLWPGLLRQPARLLPALRRALVQHRLLPGQLALEVAEGLALDRSPAVQATLAELHQAGFALAVSGFGGRGLASLPRLPVAEVWMDRSLVGRLPASPDACAHAEAVIKLAHALARRVVGDGVETAAQRDWLVQQGCDALQGRLLARPMSASALGTWLLDGDRWDPEGVAPAKIGA